MLISFRQSLYCPGFNIQPVWTSARYNGGEAAMTWSGLGNNDSLPFDGAPFTAGVDTSQDSSGECVAVTGEGFLITTSCLNGRNFVCMCGGEGELSPCSLKLSVPSWIYF